MARNSIYILVVIGSYLTVGSCSTYSASSKSKIASVRTIILNGTDTLTENDFGDFNTWKCHDFINGGRTLVEVGNFSDPDIDGIGFVLFDGGNKGEKAEYYRSGLNHRWNWSLDLSDDSYDYSFVIKPDGTGLFYDFSSIPSGETIKANDVFKCRQK